MTLDDIRALVRPDLVSVDSVIRARLKSSVALVDSVADWWRFCGTVGGVVSVSADAGVASTAPAADRATASTAAFFRNAFMG